MLDGSEKYVEIQFRCMTCGHLYIEEEREFCEAPPVGQVLAAQKAKALYEAKKSGEFLRPAEAKLAQAIETVVDGKPSEETRLSDEQLDFLLRQAWADEVFAFKDGKQKQHPGDILEYVARRKKEFQANGAQGATTEPSQ